MKAVRTQEKLDTGIRNAIEGTYGLQKAGIPVVADIDIDKSCEYAYTHNNDCEFIGKSVEEVTGKEIKKLLSGADIKILVGCAPCQPFLSHNKNKKTGIAAVVLWAHRKFYRPEFKHPCGKLFLAAELALALAVQYFDHTGFVEMYLFIVIGDAPMAYGLTFSLPLAVLALASYAGMLYFKSAPAELSVFWREIDASLLASSV